MQSWNTLRTRWGKPIYVGYAFKRIWQGGHSNQSQHYAGMAMDIGQKNTVSERDAIRNLAIDLGIFGYVEPKALTPTWVNVLLEEEKVIIYKEIFKVQFDIFQSANFAL